MIRKIIDITLSMSIIILLIVVIKGCVYHGWEKQTALTTDSTRFYVDKYDRQVAYVQALEVSRKDLKNRIDSLKITKKTKSVTKIKTVTKFKEIVKTNVIHDTINIKKGAILQPTYTADIVNKWHTANIVSKHDSTTLKIGIHNDLIIHHKQKNSLFKIKKILVEVTQSNPNILTKSIESYRIKVKNPLFSLGIQTGAGFDIMTGQPVFYAGGGIGLNLVR